MTFILDRQQYMTISAFIELKKLSASTTMTDGIMYFHRHFAHNDVEGLAIFLEQRPNYFLIESEIISLAERCGDDGKAKLVNALRHSWFQLS